METIQKLFSLNIFQTKDILDVVNLVCGHQCRVDEPVEATIYALEANVEELSKFRAIAKVNLSLEVEVPVQQSQQRKTKDYLLEIPVDFFMGKIQVRVL